MAKPTVKASAKMPTKTRIDETRTAVSIADSMHPSVKGTPETIEISSDSSSDDEVEEVDASDVEDASKDTDQQKTTPPPTNGVNGDTEMGDAAAEEGTTRRTPNLPSAI